MGKKALAKKPTKTASFSKKMTSAFLLKQLLYKNLRYKFIDLYFLLKYKK